MKPARGVLHTYVIGAAALLVVLALGLLLVRDRGPRRPGNSDSKLVLFCAAIAARLPGPVLRKIFAIFLVVVAARMLIQRPRKPATDAETGVEACCGAPPTG